MVFWIAAVTQGVALGWFVRPLQGQGRRNWIRRKICHPIIFRVETIPYVETLPLHHKDPFDRMLIAQALLETIPIVSEDVAFDSYGVSRLWS